MNEFDFIRRLRDQTHSGKHSARVVTGIGDDASLIAETANRHLVVTTDLLIEDVDFYREAMPPRLLGHKALAVSLSDIAAMGARPLWSLVSIGLPADVWKSDFKDEFFAGYLALADQYGVTLAGGDVSEAKAGIVVDSIVLGEVVDGAAILRSGARAGDRIYVTGDLGGAAAGLKLIEMGARVGASGLASLPRAGARDVSVRSVPGAAATGSERASAMRSVPGAVATGSPEMRGTSPTVRESSDREPGAIPTRSLETLGTSPTVREGSDSMASDNSELKAIESLLLRQLRPSPRVGWGIVLGEERLATAMIDISDGLSSDLSHLCSESNLGALIQSAQIPIDKEVIKICGRRALDPLALALHGGEDFELLFTVRPEEVARLPKRVDGVPITCIGEVTEQPGSIKIAERNRVWDLPAEGFEHFKA
jgi:thiamine monophosphate kinase